VLPTGRGFSRRTKMSRSSRKFVQSRRILRRISFLYVSSDIVLKAFLDLDQILWIVDALSQIFFSAAEFLAKMARKSRKVLETHCIKVFF
jgi:hypothetical protein